MQYPLQQRGFLQLEERILEGREHEQASYQSEKFNVTELSLLREFWGNNHAHVILTSEADSLSTDKKFLEDCGLVGCHSSRSSDLSVQQEMIPQGMFVSCGSQVEKMTETHMQRFLEFGEKAEAEPRERTADSLFSDKESVAFVVEGSDLNTTEGNFVPTARCIQHTKERQLVTRSGLQRLRCCVCHLHHERAMDAPVSVKQFI